MFEDTNPRKLDELLQLIGRREMALPDFQRDFVWEPGATRELIISIAQNYPAGSLLRLSGGAEMFAARAFEGAPILDSAKPNYLVLDGQQRLTSLYQAFYGVGEHRYFLKLETLLEEDDFDEAIFYQRATTRRAERLSTIEVQANEKILPLAVIFGSDDGFSGWSLEVRETLDLTNDERVALERKFNGIKKQWLDSILNYSFPVVTLSAETPPDAVCTIFETLNRTGVKLSVFDLLTARFWTQNVKLRDLWAGALNQYPIIADFDIDPYYVLQGVALAARKTPSCKRSDVLRLGGKDIEKWWDRVVAGLAAALAILREDCGVITKAWLPYYTITIPFAAILALRPMPKGPQASANRAKLVRWFWCSVMGQAYESSPNSQAARDVTAVIGWLDGKAAPETVSEISFDPRQLRQTTPRQRALYRGVIALTLKNGARDFHNFQPITANLIESNHIDDHHIFPLGWHKKTTSGASETLRNCVLNRTLIDRTTNNLIRDRAPSDYMREISDLAPSGQFDALTKSHLIPGGDESPLWEDDFERHLELRQALMWEQIRGVTGLKEASDLIEEKAVA